MVLQVFVIMILYMETPWELRSITVIVNSEGAGKIVCTQVSSKTYHLISYNRLLFLLHVVTTPTRISLQYIG